MALYGLAASAPDACAFEWELTIDRLDAGAVSLGPTKVQIRSQRGSEVRIELELGRIELKEPALVIALPALELRCKVAYLGPTRARCQRATLATPHGPSGGVVDFMVSSEGVSITMHDVELALFGGRITPDLMHRPGRRVQLDATVEQVGLEGLLVDPAGRWEVPSGAVSGRIWVKEMDPISWTGIHFC